MSRTKILKYHATSAHGISLWWVRRTLKLPTWRPGRPIEAATEWAEKGEGAKKSTIEKESIPTELGNA